MKKKVLVLEDEDNIRAFVVINLKRAGYETVEFALGEEAAEHLRDHRDVAIAILDVMLPDISGFDVCRRIRGMGSKMGVIMLTAMGQESDRVTGLMTGADDYVTKPFSVAELVAIIKPSAIASAPLFIIGWGMLIYGVVELLNAFKVSNNKRIWLKNQQQKPDSKEIYVDVEEVKNEE
mgnify:CR=1 FL=1